MTCRRKRREVGIAARLTTENRELRALIAGLLANNRAMATRLEDVEATLAEVTGG